MATQMQGFIWKEIAWPPRYLERKNINIIFCLHTWITEKELKQVIENKGDEFRWKNNMKIL